MQVSESDGKISALINCHHSLFVLGHTFPNRERKSSNDDAMIIMMMTKHALTIMISSVSGASDYKQCRCTFSNPAKRGEMGENKW